MSLYQHILLAVDFSKNGEQVTEYAQKLAKQFNAKLSIVHVLELAPVMYEGDFSLPIGVSYEEELEKQATLKLHQITKQLNIDKKDCYLEQGSVKLGVTYIAKKINADLIIAGTHGHHGIIENLIGSRVNSILHAAECDVLVVRIKEK